MARYSIKSTFTANPTAQNRFQISDDSGIVFDFIYVASYGDGGGIATEIGISPQNYLNTVNATYGVFQTTYNTTGSYTNNLNGDNVEWIGVFDGIPTVSISPDNVTHEITEIVDPLVILSTTVLTNGAQPCNWFNINVITNYDVIQLNKPYLDTQAPSQSFIVENQTRDSIVNIEVEDAEGNTASTSVTLPGFLDANLIEVIVVGQSVVVNNYTGLDVEYSIDNVNWQTNNTFNGILGGDHTIYVRDIYDCKISIPFTIDEGDDGSIIIVDPYFEYPDANPVRMASRVDWDDCSLLKNDHNTLSCESTDRITYTELQRWRDCDTIHLQFKTNYDDLRVVTSDDPNTDLTLIQKTDFMNQKQAMDCKVVKLSDTTNGVYFLSGETYDYDTLTPLDDPYTLNGELPGWAIVGNVITIGGIGYTMADLVYNEDLRVNQIVITGVLAEGDYICKAIYNIFPYNVFETSILVTGKPLFNIEIHYDGTLQYSSELQAVDETQPNLIKVQYYMDYNTNMFWATGIQPYMRINVDVNNLGIKRTNETYDTDISYKQIDVNNYRQDVYKFFPVTKEEARKIITIFSSSNININGIDFICEEVTSETLGSSNLYVLTATMVESGSGLAKSRTGNTYVSLSALVKGETGYIKL